MNTVDFSIRHKGSLLLFFVFLLTTLVPLSSRAELPPMTESEFVSEVNGEYDYRKRLELEAPKWAKELVYFYKWSAKYPVPYHPVVGAIRGDQKPSAEEVSQRMNSEFAWMLVTGHGLLATFDFRHAEQSLLGSTSRLVAGLTKSRAFWREVKAQCEEVATLAKARGRSEMTAKSCAERLDNDLRVSQLVGSNVSLFVGGGLVIGLGKRVFTKYFSGWFARRVVPMIPAAARSGWVLGGLTAAVVVLPAGYLVASLEKERETSREFLENLPEALKETEDLRLKESVLRRHALELERDVVQLAIWINQRLPNSGGVRQSYEGMMANQEEAQRFLMDLKLMAPGYQTLLARRDQASSARQSLEDELSRIPSVHAHLMSLYEKKRLGELTEDDKALLRKAQYLAALRLVVPVLNNNTN